MHVVIHYHGDKATALQASPIAIDQIIDIVNVVFNCRFHHKCNIYDEIQNFIHDHAIPGLTNFIIANITAEWKI